MAGPSELTRRRMLGGMVAAPFVMAHPSTRRTAAGREPGFNINSLGRGFQNAADTVVIIIDDLRPDFVGALQLAAAGTGYAYPGDIHTPNLDAVLAESAVFANAYASVPVCIASRTSALFGAAPNVTGIRRDAGLGSATGPYDAFKSLQQAGGYMHLAEHLAAEGVGTSVVGKVDHTDDFVDLYTEAGPYTDIASLFGPATDGLAGPDGSFLAYGVLDPNETHSDQLVTDDFLQRVAQRDGAAQPWVDFVGLYQPHTPWLVHQEYFDLYPLESVALLPSCSNDFADLGTDATALATGPPSFFGLPRGEFMESLGEDVMKRHIQAYLASVSHTDAMIGQLFDSGALDGKNVVLWSDHGFHLGEKLHWSKGTLWEQSAKCLLAISEADPGSYSAGTTTRPVSCVGLAATVCELAGIEPFEGNDDAAPWDGVAFSDPAQQCVLQYWDYEVDSQSIAAQSAVYEYEDVLWRLTAYRNADGDLADVELYDLHNDPNEYNNLANAPATGACATEIASYKSAQRGLRLRTWLAEKESQ